MHVEVFILYRLIPLLRILGQQNFLIYLYGWPRGGKTAALKMALSVWGIQRKQWPRLILLEMPWRERQLFTEIYGKPIDDEGIASLLHTRIDEAYGVAGPIFIKEVIRCLQVSPGMFKYEFNRVRMELKSQFPDNIDSHISSVAVIALGDLYMRAWLFDVSEGVALEGAVELGEAILALLEKKSDTDDAKRGYDAFMSWYLVHQSYFSLESRDIYGWRTVDMIHIYPIQFRKAMKELGFNDLRMRRDCGNRGWIAVEEEIGKQHADGIFQI